MDMDWREILIQLEARLEGMAAAGAGYLNIEKDPTLGEELAAFLETLPPRPAPEGTGPGRPPPAPSTIGRGRDEEGPTAPVAGHPGRPAAPFPRHGIAETAKRSQAPLPPDATAPETTVPDATVPDPTAPGTAAPEPGGAPAGPAAKPTETTAPAEIHTLESLAFHFRNCMACGLGASRNRLVFGTGPGRPAILFIGEGPGAEEDQQGLPFVGKAGELLTGLIAALGLTRDDVYITNVVKCRPPGNRNPEAGEAAACRPILERQIELLDPSLIVTLGNVPLKALKPSAAGITRERGSTFSYRSWTVLPTFHPSYLLRDPTRIETCWRDFKQAFQLAYGPTPG